ncbi:MAG: hypothetical protein ACTSU5_14340 [Promethearchaeota archaeon]
MQAYTHFLVGILVQVALREVAPTWLRVLLVGVIAFLSHFPVDVFAKVTYHPPEARPRDPFWVGYHVYVLVVSVVVLVVFWGGYWFAMGCAVLVDLYDWVFIRGVRALKKDPEWGERFQFHPVIERIREGAFGWLPDWNHERRGVVPELVLLVVLLVPAILFA